MWCACGVSAHLCKVEAFSAVIKHQPSHQLKPCLRLDEGCDKQRCCLHAQPHVTLTIQCAQSTPATFRDFCSCGLDAPFTCCTDIPCNWLFDRELKSASDLSLPWPIDPLTGCVNGQRRAAPAALLGSATSSSCFCWSERTPQSASKPQHPWRSPSPHPPSVVHIQGLPQLRLGRIGHQLQPHLLLLLLRQGAQVSLLPAHDADEAGLLQTRQVLAGAAPLRVLLQPGEGCAGGEGARVGHPPAGQEGVRVCHIFSSVSYCLQC